MAENINDIDKTRTLETKSIKSLLWEYALPAVASQVVTSVYNIVDRVFLGNSSDGNGTLYLAALAITFPLMNIIHAFGSLVGAGASARMSIVLGRKDVRWAEKILGNTMLLTFFFGFLFVTAGYLWMKPILTLFGASEDTIVFACQYMDIVLPGMFLVTMTYNLTGLIRASGYPMKAMWIMIGGAVVNIFLDFLFISMWGLGVVGAAWGTTISMALTALVSVVHFVQPHSFIRFKAHAWVPKLYIFRNILAIGISPFSMNVAAFAVVAVLNMQLSHYGGDNAVAVYGVVNSAAGLILMMFLGVCQGMQPIAGYNYGAGRNDRLKEVYRLTQKVCIALGIFGMAVSMIFPRTIISCFNSEEQILSIGVPALRYLMVFAPLIAYTIVNSQLFQSIDQPWIAIVTSLSRQVIFLIPLSLILPGVVYDITGNGVTGVWISCAVCDVLGASLSTVLLLTHRQVFRNGYIPPVRRPRKEAGPKEQSQA
ncbi:MAG: MATE family efflux transporter [Bacteroidales bacterium]|nr:MATE family efflux transporter [Bacteroidales bacterium]